MRRRGGLALAGSLLLTLASFPALGQPDAGRSDEVPGAAWFEYRLAQDVTNGRGAYEGWSDGLVANGRYEVEGGSLRARYDWRYRSPDEERRGSEDRRVAFDPVSRLYLARPIDLDEYDESSAPQLSIWWRIPTSVTPGEVLRILEEDFQVAGPVPPSDETHLRPTILLSQAGRGTRRDAYGTFTTSYTDRYWFDAETGWFLREERTEHDVGTLEGAPAEFDVSTFVEVTAASFLPGTVAGAGGEAPARVAVSASGAEPWGRAFRRNVRQYGVLLGGGAIVLAAIYVFVASRRSAPRHDYQGTIEALGDSLPPELAGLSPFFGEVIPQLARQSRSLGPAVARGSLGMIEGLALPAPPGEAATIFARQTACCEALRQHIGATHFFSETRHEHAMATRAAASERSVSLTGTHAYNVLETHELLELAALPADITYDRQVARRGSAADLPAVVQLADAVYGGSNAAWLGAALAHGDVLLVARERTAPEGPIVGFALLTVAGTTARFSGLTVAPAQQGKGLGKELNRARLRVASDLGAARAIVEVAAWNTASLEIARASGFQKVGVMYVETAALADPNLKFRRR